MGGIASPNLTPGMAPPVMNPILDEIDAAHSRLSPDAQSAIEKAHGIAAPKAAPVVGPMVEPLPPLSKNNENWSDKPQWMFNEHQRERQPGLMLRSSGEPEPSVTSTFTPTGIAAPNGPAIEPPPGGGIQAPAPTTVGAGINPPATDNVSSASIKPAGALAVPSLGTKMPETTPTPIGGKVSPELARLTAPDTGQHNKQNTGTPGVNQIHNPWARVPLQILDALGRGFFPGVEMAIPGTSGHHDVLVHQRQAEDKQERDAQNDEAKRELDAANVGHLSAETDIGIPAQAEHDRASAEALRHPKADKQGGTVHQDAEGNYWVIHGDGSATQVAPQGGGQLKGKTTEASGGTVHTDDQGNMWVVKGDGSAVPVMPKSAPSAASNVAATGEPTVTAPTTTDKATSGVPGQLKGKPASEKEGEMALGERVPRINEAFKARYQVLHPKQELPGHYLLPVNATQKDFDRTDKLIEGEEKAFGTKANQDQTMELRKQTMALAQQNRENKVDTDIKKAAYKAYEPAMDSAERFNVMTKNYEDAVKTHDQQAMLSLLANHLGMTMGLQKGSRLTKDIIHEAEQSRPWLQGLKAKFDSNGYLSGVNLTPPQMRQMINLGRERFAEDVTKGRSQAHYMGSQDEGPERIPSKATVNHYIGLANGDAKKAKELAAQDGWLIK